ncbi:hypothetical protein CAL7102_04216 [Dulcicalothrix desertica PCC 7102]|nr:hypothetical protein CAL7102_04216 [Dulcicalothrix desertica PCC 7102]
MTWNTSHLFWLVGANSMVAFGNLLAVLLVELTSSTKLRD